MHAAFAIGFIQARFMDGPTWFCQTIVQQSLWGMSRLMLKLH